MDPEARFSAVVALDPAAIALDEAALCISAAGQPGLDVDAQLAGLDRLAEDVNPASVEGVCELLFGRLGLAGAVHNYDDPRHSWLDQVLDRGVGLPIALAVLTVEVARRRGVDLVGVGMPGHFLVGDPSRPGRYLDVYRGGRLLDTEGCRSVYEGVFGGRATWSPALLAPTPRRDILARMLANLARSYETLGDPTGRLWVARLQATIPGRPAPELTHVAARLAELGAFDVAARLLEEAGQSADIDEPTGDRLLDQATALRARLN